MMKRWGLLIGLLMIFGQSSPRSDAETILAAEPPSQRAKLEFVEPEQVGMSARRLAVIEEVVEEGLDRKQMPGCVVLIGYRGKVVYHEAFGSRQVQPERKVMEKETVFDLASLTKPLATAISVMQLVEQGKIELEAPVSQYIPEFQGYGKEKITVKQLLTHTSGLIPDNALRDYQSGPEQAFQNIHKLTLVAQPGERFMYSDVGFLMLGELVEKITGQTIHEYSQEKIYQPLGMQETGYLPRQELCERAAVTQERNGVWLQGEVHDPRAAALGGIAGHAGLFSTAADLAVLAQMLLGEGTREDVQVLKPETVRLMFEPVKVPGGWRALGWDLRTGYSSNRGDLFSHAAVGHGGFTGTSFWVDPQQELFVIFLSNRVHPNGKGAVNSLAGRIGTIAAAAIREEIPQKRATKK